MDFTVEDTYAVHRAAARDWVAENVDPSWAQEQNDSGTHHTALLHARMAEAGFLGANWPVEYCGEQADPALTTAVIQEIDRLHIHVSAWMTTQMVLNTVLRAGTEEQKREWLSAAVRGEMLVSLGYTESDSGSDLAAAKTRAVRQGDEWVINGSKMFTSFAQAATHVFLLCRTDPDVPKHGGLTIFLVPIDTPGVELRSVPTLGGQRTNATYYTDVRIPDRYRVGEVNSGWKVMRLALVFERGIVHVPDGPTWADRAADWARSVPGTQGGSVLDESGVRETLAKIAIESEIARLMAARVAWIVETGGLPAMEGPAHKLFSTETTQAHLACLLDLVGERAVLQGEEGDEFGREVESALRKSVVSTIYGGSSEVLREIVAERKLGLPRSRQRTS